MLLKTKNLKVEKSYSFLKLVKHFWNSAGILFQVKDMLSCKMKGTSPSISLCSIVILVLRKKLKVFFHWSFCPKFLLYSFENFSIIYLEMSLFYRFMFISFGFCSHVHQEDHLEKTPCWWCSFQNIKLFSHGRENYPTLLEFLPSWTTLCWCLIVGISSAKSLS